MGLKVVASVQPANVLDHVVRHPGAKTPADLFWSLFQRRKKARFDRRLLHERCRRSGVPQALRLDIKHRSNDLLDEPHAELLEG